MREVYGYLKTYYTLLDKGAFLLTAALMAVLVLINYTIGIDHRITGIENRGVRFLYYFLLFLFVFSSSYVLSYKYRKDAVPQETWFYVLMVFSTALFAVKMSIQSLPPSFDSFFQFPSLRYWKLVMNWPVKGLLVIAGIYACWKLMRLPAPMAGMSGNNINYQPYWILLLLMFPILMAASFTDSFQIVYPKLQNIQFIEWITSPVWHYYFLYELAYGFDFFTIELFFRGFLVLGFLKFAGSKSILPMAAFYCTIHFGKPMAECISSFFGGLILGAIVFNTRSIWGGLIVHLGIAWLMELIGIIMKEFK